MHMHVHGAYLLGSLTYLSLLIFVPLFPRRRLLCYLVMVYITIDDLVLDHLQSGHQFEAARLRMLPACHSPDPDLTTMNSEGCGPTPTSERPTRFDIIADVSANITQITEGRSSERNGL
jgi:hypothetical protein